jgi:hypothetical protein
MSRDPIIEEIFLTADDAMQGLWGLHSYVKAAVETADREEMKQRLPSGSFRLTHEWVRYYDRDELVKEMDDVFVFVHARNSLVGLVAIFEGAVLRLNERLSAMSLAKQLDKYKHLLAWTFEIVRSSTSGSPSMLSRLPEVCGDVDNGRRLRNCVAHNNGRYEQFYLDDAIQNWVQVSHLPMDVNKAITAKEKILITNNCFEKLLHSHVELLHILHNTIQSTFFHEQEGYNYAKESKGIEWHRIFSGRASVAM